MIKGKRGNVFFGVTIGLFCFFFGVLFIPFFEDDITTARVNLDCSNVSISDGVKWTCLNIDLVVPYIILFFTSLAIGVLGGISK
jgi:hypothetical protein